MSTISTHVLDTARGVPAEGVPITLDRLTPEGWQRLTAGVTNDDGRVRDFLPPGTTLEPGTWRMAFDTRAYFDRHGVEGFYPYVHVVFELKDGGQHTHVPLLLSPFGYSTYRGS